jgi:hypothetical protein
MEKQAARMRSVRFIPASVLTIRGEVNPMSLDAPRLWRSLNGQHEARPQLPRTSFPFEPTSRCKK